MDVHLFPLKDLSFVPAADRPSSFFFCDSLLTVCTSAETQVVLVPISDLEESSVWVSPSDDSSAVGPDFPGLGRKSW